SEIKWVHMPLPLQGILKDILTGQKSIQMRIKFYVSKGGIDMPQPLETINRIMENGVVAVIRKVPADKVVAVADSLVQGGINALEVTLDSEDALQTITKLQHTFKGQAIIRSEERRVGKESR